MQVQVLKMLNGRKVKFAVNLETLTTDIFEGLKEGFDFFIKINGKELSFVRPMPLKVITAFVR